MRSRVTAKRLPDFFERVFAAILQAESQPDDLFLARRQGLQNFGRLLVQVEVDDLLGRGEHGPDRR